MIVWQSCTTNQAFGVRTRETTIHPLYRSGPVAVCQRRVGRYRDRSRTSFELHTETFRHFPFTISTISNTTQHNKPRQNNKERNISMEVLLTYLEYVISFVPWL